MKHLAILISLLLISCGKSITTRNDVVDLTAMKAKLATYEGYYPTCKYPQLVGVSKDTCQAEGTGSGDADVMLWSGLLCLSGNAIGCSTASNSFDVNGKAHRSPGRLSEADFSRDMFLGSLAYLIGTKDSLTAAKYLSRLEANHNNLCIAPCELTMATWGAASIVWKYLGLPLTLNMRIGRQLDEVGALPGVLYNEGYQLHLLMVTALLHQQTGSYQAAWKGMTKIIYDRQPQNPFAAYLWLGTRQEVVDLAVNKMPTIISVHRNQWSFEREQNTSDWNNSMLWEWLFLFNLMGGK